MLRKNALLFLSIAASLWCANAQNRTVSVTADPEFYSCLTRIAGATIVRPTDPDYARESLSFNYRFNYQPVAVVIPTTEPQVQAAVRCARQFNIAVAPRAGGHCYEGYGIGGKDGALVIDVKRLDTVVVDRAAETAVCGAGNKLGKLYVDLWDAGEFAFPAGSAPTVGLAGIVLGGGIGFMANQYGLSADSVLEMRMVDANGELLTISAQSNEDLFWALRGAGHGSFGVVTSFTLKIYRVSQRVTHFNFGWDDPTKQTAIDVWTAYTDLARQHPANMTSGSELIPDEVHIYGIYLGPVAEARAVFQPLFDRVPTRVSTETFVESTLIDAHLSMSDYPTTDYRNLADPEYDTSDRYWKSSGLLHKEPLSIATVSIIWDFLLQHPSDTRDEISVTIDYFGGVNSRVITHPKDYNAFNHRDQLFDVQLLSAWGDDAAEPGRPECLPCLQWHRSFFQALSDNFRAEYGDLAFRAYVNYIDKGLDGWLDAYYGDGVERLADTKTTHDPDNLFDFPQAIPTKQKLIDSGWVPLDRRPDSSDATHLVVGILSILSIGLIW